MIKRRDGIRWLGWVWVLLATSTFAKDTSLQEQLRFEQALLLSQKGLCSQALPIWKALQSQAAQSLDIANNRAACLIQLGDYKAAKQILEQAIASDQTRETAWENLNTIYAYEARQAYHQIFKGKPVDKPKVHWVLSWKANSNKEGQSTKEKALVGQVLQVMEQWRSAWAGQQVKRYLSFYSNKFIPENGVSYRQWQTYRQRSVSRPKYIHLALSGIQTAVVNPKLVWVHAQQTYQSNRYRDKVAKAWLWYNEKGHWKILKEMTLPNVAQ